jgi:DNA-binding MarR family transcriptional regulator
VAESRQAINERFPHDPDPDDPLIGARLRFALTAVEKRIEQALREEGFADLNRAHFKVLRFPPPENERPIDLAQRAGMTKQAMNYLLTQLEEMGYVRRLVEGGSNGRLVSLTEKGWKVAQVQRSAVRAVEQEWAQRAGRARFSVLSAVLDELMAASSDD